MTKARSRARKLPTCPNRKFVWRLTTAGQLWPAWYPCGQWSCDACRRERLGQIAIRIARATSPLDILYVGKLTAKQYTAFRQQISRKKEGRSVGYLLLKVQDGYYAVTNIRVAGRGWRLQECFSADFLLDFWEHIPYRVKRGQFAGAWRKEDDKSEPRTHTVLQFNGRYRLLREALSDANVPITGELKPDEVADAAHRVSDALAARGIAVQLRLKEEEEK